MACHVRRPCLPPHVLQILHPRIPASEAEAEDDLGPPEEVCLCTLARASFTQSKSSASGTHTWRTAVEFFFWPPCCVTTCRLMPSYVSKELRLEQGFSIGRVCVHGASSFSRVLLSSPAFCFGLSCPCAEAAVLAERPLQQRYLGHSENHRLAELCCFMSHVISSLHSWRN